MEGRFDPKAVFEKGANMRKLLLVSVSAFTGALLAVLLLGISIGARAGGGAVAIDNGDTNGDGDIDIADVVYTLIYLFQGGPAPVPIESEGPLYFGLPDTGQATCYDEFGNNIDCVGEVCIGQDGLYATGCASDGRFTDNGDGTVTDNCTGLMWQKDTADVNGDGRVPEDTSDAVSWCDALAYCENLSFASHDEWRLPNVRELQSVVDYSRVGGAMDSVFGALSAHYWSSTSRAGYPEFAWHVVFYSGSGGCGDLGVYVLEKVVKLHVRAVRTAP